MLCLLYPQCLLSLVVQWLGHMTFTHETRVQFPAREPELYAACTAVRSWYFDQVCQWYFDRVFNIQIHTCECSLSSLYCTLVAIPGVPGTW